MKLRNRVLGLAFVFVFVVASGSVKADKLPRVEVAKRSFAINRLMTETYEKLDVQPNGQVDDATFVRRAYIQIIGRVPTAREATDFLREPSNARRHDLIDSLVDSPGFRHKLFNFYADLLRLKSQDSARGLGWHVWLKQAVAANKPYDELVYEMLSSSGHASTNPAVGYYLRDRDNLLDNVSNSAMVFLGMQIGCAQCHDDPFGETTQLQYFQLAAYSAGIAYDSDFPRQAVKGVVGFKAQAEKNVNISNDKRASKAIAKEVEKDLKNLLRPYSQQEITQTDRKLKLPHDYQYSDGEPGQTVKPATLLGTMPDLSRHKTPRQAFAAWVVLPGNERFSQTIVNRLWAHVFGGGLREPLDNWDSNDDVPHAKVLDSLVSVLHETDYDLRETLRVMYHTALFQRSATNEEIAMGTVSDFRGPTLRRMTGEEIFDSLLTMQHGDIDANTNTELREHWASYAREARGLRDASPQVVLAVDTALDELSQQKGQKKKAFKELKERISAARKAGDLKRVAELERLKKEGDKKRDRGASDKSIESTYSRTARTLISSGYVPESSIQLRSSELPSPQPLGSIVRRFGGSDRATVNAGHTKPSIPQLLTMLNGEDTDKITRPRGVIVSGIKQLSNNKQRLDRLFLQFFACLPSAEERTKLEPLVATSNGIATVARAMLSSKRFLFVQ